MSENANNQLTARSDTQWLAELHSGCNQAAQAIFERYFPKAERFASRRLAMVNCREADGEDIALSALKSFFLGVRDKRFPDLCTSNDLWRLLAMLTARKAVQQRRRVYRKKRGANMVRGESVFARPDESHAGGLAEAVVAPENRDLELRELMNSLLDALKSDELRKIAVLKLYGATTREISEDLGCTPRTVERKVRRIRERWIQCGFADQV